MPENKKRLRDPIMHDWVEDDSDVVPDLPQEDPCPKGGFHTMVFHARSPFCPDGDPAWTQEICTKCGHIETSH